MYVVKLCPLIIFRGSAVYTVKVLAHAIFVCVFCTRPTRHAQNVSVALNCQNNFQNAGYESKHFRKLNPSQIFFMTDENFGGSL